MQTVAAQALGFSSPLAHVEVLEDVEDFPVLRPTVIVNLGTEDAFVGAGPMSALPGFSSTILVGGRVSGKLLAALTLEDIADQEKLARELGWTDFYGGDGPVLLKSGQNTVGTVRFDPATVLHQPGTSGGAADFTLKANLWFSPAGTDCGIHNDHAFIEIHTQITGYGRMQKFTDREHETLYEEQLLSPGATNPVPFCLENQDSFVYPWHQYRADTDCIWLALEYRRI